MLGVAYADGWPECAAIVRAKIRAGICPFRPEWVLHGERYCWKVTWWDDG